MGTNVIIPKRGDRVSWSGYARDGELMGLSGQIAFVEEAKGTFCVCWERIPIGRGGQTVHAYALDVPFTVFAEPVGDQEWVLEVNIDAPNAGPMEPEEVGDAA